MAKCKHCEFLNKTFDNGINNNYVHWLYTEMFVYLHKGKDYCDKSKKKNFRYFVGRLKYFLKIGV